MVLFPAGDASDVCGFLYFTVVFVFHAGKVYIRVEVRVHIPVDVVVAVLWFAGE